MKIQYRPPFTIGPGYLEVDESEMISVPVGTRSQDESNAFLLALWNEMNLHIAPQSSPAHIPWAYFPYRMTEGEHSISVMGYAQTSLGELLTAITYKAKGTIDKILFYPIHQGKKTDDLANTLSTLVGEALAKRDFTSRYVVECRLKPGIEGFGIVPYATDKFTITHNAETGEIELCFTVDAVDEFEAEESAMARLNDLCAFLSVETNLEILPASDFTIAVDATLNPDAEANSGYAMPYIDFYPRKNNSWNLILSKEAVTFIDNIILGGGRFYRIDPAARNFLDACHHALAGITLEQQLGYKPVFGSITQVFYLRDKTERISQSVVSQMAVEFLSAVETVTTGEPTETCPTCGTPKYKISERVRNLCSRYLGENIGSIMHQLYGTRSKYVHTGRQVTRHSLRTSRPTIDAGTTTRLRDDGGISVKYPGGSAPIGTNNIKEWSTFVLRCHYQEQFCGRTDFNIPDPDEAPLMEAVDPGSDALMRKVLKQNTNPLLPLADRITARLLR